MGYLIEIKSIGSELRRLAERAAKAVDLANSQQQRAFVSGLAAKLEKACADIEKQAGNG